MIKKMLQSFKANWFHNIVLIVLIIFVIMMAVQIQDLRLVNKDNTDNTGSTFMVYQNLPTNYFQPTGKPDSVQGDTVSTDVLGDLDPTLYGYVANKATNASSGVNTSDVVALMPSFFNKVRAKSPYPVIYTSSYRGRTASEYQPQLIEINIYTGKKRVLYTGDVGAGTFNTDFSQINQIVAFSIRNNISLPNTTSKIYLYDLKSAKTREIYSVGGNNIDNLRWSPDGNTLAWSERYYDPSNPTMSYDSIVFYDYKTAAIQKFNFNKTGDNKGYYVTSMFSWADSSEHLIIDVFDSKATVPGENSYRYIAKISKQNGTEVRMDADINTNNYSYNAFEVANKIIGQTISRNFDEQTERSRFAQDLGNSYGWLFIYDQATKTKKDFKELMGDYFSPSTGYIVTKDCSKILFNKSLDDKQHGFETYMIDVVADNITKLNSPKNSYYRIVGWAGNEDNVLLWDNTNTFYTLNIKTNKLYRISN